MLKKEFHFRYSDIFFRRKLQISILLKFWFYFLKSVLILFRFIVFYY